MVERYYLHFTPRQVAALVRSPAGGLGAIQATTSHREGKVLQVTFGTAFIKWYFSGVEMTGINRCFEYRWLILTPLLQSTRATRPPACGDKPTGQARGRGDGRKRSVTLAARARVR